MHEKSESKCFSDSLQQHVIRSIIDAMKSNHQTPNTWHLTAVATHNSQVLKLAHGVKLLVYSSTEQLASFIILCQRSEQNGGETVKCFSSNAGDRIYIGWERGMAWRNERFRDKEITKSRLSIITIERGETIIIDNQLNQSQTFSSCRSAKNEDVNRAEEGIAWSLYFDRMRHTKHCIKYNHLHDFVVHM